MEGLVRRAEEGDISRRIAVGTRSELGIEDFSLSYELNKFELSTYAFDLESAMTGP
jgi:hypothetical protein